MKKLLFFILFGMIVCPGKVFAKAECVGYTQERCCSFKNTFTLSDAISYCGEGNYSDDGVYYAGCYKCIRCKKGYYLSGNGCRPCYSNVMIDGGKCWECSSSTVCTAIECSRGYYSTGTECKHCPDGSTAEAGATSCTLCPPGTYGANGFCHSCETNHWSSEAGSTSCQWCYTIPVEHGKCRGCTKDGICTKAYCDSGYADNNGKCEELNCAPGETVYGEGCKACGSKMWSTGGNTRQCWTCSSIKIEKGTCTDCTVDGTCTAVSCNKGYTANGAKCEKITCPTGEYLSGSTCKACSTIPVENGTCKACTSGASCDAVDCNIGYKTVGTTCVKVECPLNCAACDSWGFCYQCENGYTLSDDRLSCLPACSENCKTCSNGVCTDCGDGYTLSDGKCLDCSVYNVGNGTCTECDEYGCTDAECNGSNTFFNPTFRKCGVECDVNQYLDSSYTCRDCPAGQTSSGGWFANPTNCYSCDSIPVDGGRCTECKNGSCTKAECEDGYVLDSTGRTCIAALASCLSPLKISDDGCCCVK